MPNAQRLISASGIYHVMLRGNNRQRIFENDEDYRYFLEITNRNRKQSGFLLYAWCLLPNHIHLLLKEKSEPVSLTIQRIEVSFISWYNRKYDRTGHLFQGRFRSEVVEDSNYFLKVIRYIHMNPVKAGLCETPDVYPYSSFAHYFCGNVSEDDMLFGLIGRKEFKAYHFLENDDSFSVISEKRAQYLTDTEICRLVYESLGIEHISDVSSMPARRRNEILHFMLKSGTSLRQACRLTGVSMTIIRDVRNFYGV